MIYLDSAAAYPVLPCALDALTHTSQGNPNSAHAAGEAARDALEQARSKIAAIIGAKPEQIHFFPAATAAAQTAIYSLTAAGYGVVRYDTEHHAVLNSTYIERETAQSRGANGIAYARMLANNETGEIYAPPEREPGMPWLCDATAAVGHIPVTVEQLGCTYLIADAMKFGGVPGAAFLYVAPGAPFFPMIEGGTPSVALIAAMAAALEWQTEHMRENTIRMNSLRFGMINELLEISDSTLNTPYESAETIPHIINRSLPGVDGKALALLLSKEGVCVSAGAACTTGNNAPSHVLMAMYHDETRARSAIRISLSHENTAAECEQAAKKIAECVAHLRAIG